MKVLDFSAALVLSGIAALGVQTLPAAGQSAGTTGTAATAKPNPYEGVSQPPASDTITATEAQPAVPPVTPPPSVQPSVTPAPAVSAPAASVASSGSKGVSGNPDSGIVETPVPDTPASAVANTPRLQTRGHFNPDATIVTSVSLPDNELPEGTPVHARIDQEISSRENGVGTPWTAQVSQDVVQNGRVFIPVGSVIHGRVTHADYGRRMYGPASLRLTPDDVVLPDGTRYALHALVSQTGANSNTKTGREGAIRSKDHMKRTAAEVAAGGGSGAVLGAAVGGPAGAIAGSAIGVGVVTAHWLRTNHAAVLPANSIITFGLTQPLILNSAQASNATHP